jgi:uncharacterized protein (TIGR02145 family)
MKRLCVCFISTGFLAVSILSDCFAQVSVNNDGSPPDSSSILDVKSKSAGLLIPRMTSSEISFINNPAEGLIVYNTEEEVLFIFVESLGRWKEMAYSTGEIFPFLCGSNLVDDRDGKSYPTVLIGNQCWMKANLNVGTQINGGVSPADNGTIEKYCNSNNAGYCTTYGGLYLWNELMDYNTAEGGQGICPSGWHVPSNQEWKTLEGIADSQYDVGDPIWDQTGYRGFDAGGNLKEIGTSHWISPNTGATNATGFTALPGGLWNGSAGNWSAPGYGTLLWTSSMTGSNVWSRAMNNTDKKIQLLEQPVNYGFSVRCLKNTAIENNPPSQPSGPAPADGAQFQYINSDLAWTASVDPENGPVTYSVYFGTSSTPPMVASGITANSYALGTLTAATVYYWKIVAFDGTFQVAGPVWSFGTCGNTLTDSRDSQVYGTVPIGNQCWMQNNLNVGLWVSLAQGQTNNGTIEKYCYEDIEGNCSSWGGLYKWNEMMQYSETEGAIGICPAGWHIPTTAEWATLMTNLGGESVAGGKMKQTGYIYWMWPNECATNESGFTALGSGFSDQDAIFIDMGMCNFLWSSSGLVNDPTAAWLQVLNFNTCSCDISTMEKNESGLSVRCLKD